MDAEDELFELGLIYGARFHDRGYESLNEAEWTVYCVTEFTVETIDNGVGYENWHASFFAHVVAALERIGAREAAVFARAAYELHPEAAPEHSDDERDRAVTELDERFSRAEPLVTAHAVEYLRKHRHELRLSDAEAAPSDVLDGWWRQCRACMDAWEEEPGAELATCPNCQRLTIRRTPPAVIRRHPAMN